MAMNSEIHVGNRRGFCRKGRIWRHSYKPVFNAHGENGGCSVFVASGSTARLKRAFFMGER
ncbi:hypothetical protein BRW84_06995 [Oxalobacter formigenes OXCC13]|nr:hypothetical protein BRW84_06995 [Oxalobacter formigenes OXCC13]